MKYCYWTSNCSKGISNIENYKCCNDCKKKDCEVRCKDCYDNCKYAATQQEIEQSVFAGSAAGGMVTVEATGTKQINKITIKINGI